MTVVAVPLWVDQAILIGTGVVCLAMIVAVFVTALGLCRMAALGDEELLSSSPHDARDGVAPHPEPGAGTPSPVPGSRGPWSPNKGGER